MFLDKLQAWLKKPFDPNGDVVDWVLFLGFALIVAFMWSRVLKQIRD
jgi:hypothetical protein